jgi:hypothetical protein
MVHNHDVNLVLIHRGHTNAQLDAMSEDEAWAVVRSTNPPVQPMSDAEIGRVVCRKIRNTNAARRAGTLIRVRIGQ